MQDSVLDFIGSTANHSDGVTLNSPGMGDTSVDGVSLVFGRRHERFSWSEKVDAPLSPAVCSGSWIVDMV
jgi:hypothetical protein